jgi:serine/threonine protein kinase
MEYTDSNTVNFFLSKKQSCIILESSLQTIVSQILRALDSLHSMKIIHGNLKVIFLINYIFLEKLLTGYFYKFQRPQVFI